MSLFRGFDAESLPSVWDCGQQAQLRLLPADWQLLGEDSFFDVSEETGEGISVGVRLYQHRTDSSCFYEVTRRTPSGEPWDGWTVGVDLTQQQAEEWFVVHEVAPPNHLRAAWESSLKGPARAGGSDPLPESESRTVVDNRGSDSESSGADSLGLGPMLETDVPTLILDSRKFRRHVVVDQVMRKTLREIPEAEQWGQREWVEYLKCSPKTLQKCPTWEGIQLTRAARKQARVIPEGIREK